MTSIITLLQKYTEGLLEAQNSFMEHLESFPELEKTVTELSNRMAADFLGACLTGADGLIRESGIRRALNSRMIEMKLSPAARAYLLGHSVETNERFYSLTGKYRLEEINRILRPCG